MRPLLKCALLAVPLLAAIPAMAEAAPPANAVIEPTCADLMAAIRVADPGERPTRQRQAEAKAAQDVIATGLFWLHGWHYGRGQATLPVTKDWMVAELKRVVEACRTHSPDGALPFSQAAIR